MPPSVAIIMRAKNEMPHARAALEMLKQQSFSNYALFAIDSGSTDGTLDALKEQAAILKQIAPGDYVPGKVLNNAIAETNHDIIVLLNADAIPQSKDWLEKLLCPIFENNADASFSKQIARPDARFVVTYDYERAYHPANVEPGFFSAVACAFKRDLWKTTLFREEGYAEDIAWAEACLALGARFAFAESSVVEHSHNYSLKQLHQKRYRQALTFNQTPNGGRQCYLCTREIVRDFFQALARLKPQTIPYNIAYRITIHRAIHQGLKAR